MTGCESEAPDRRPHKPAAVFRLVHHHSHSPVAGAPGRSEHGACPLSCRALAEQGLTPRRSAAGSPPAPPPDWQDGGGSYARGVSGGLRNQKVCEALKRPPQRLAPAQPRAEAIQGSRSPVLPPRRRRGAAAQRPNCSAADGPGGRRSALLDQGSCPTDAARCGTLRSYCPKRAGREPPAVPATAEGFLERFVVPHGPEPWFCRPFFRALALLLVRSCRCHQASGGDSRRACVGRPLEITPGMDWPL
jgi:hypothetical protein